MTTQIPEVLLHRGKRLDLCDHPLETFLDTLPKEDRPRFAFVSTALGRGYVSTWSTDGGMISLVGLQGTQERDGRFVEVGLADVLPSLRPPVPATWLTAWLRCPEGELLEYTHRGFADIYERDRIFRVIEGRVVGEWVRLNGDPAGGPVREQPYRAGYWVRLRGEVRALYRIRPDRSRVPVADYRLNAPALPDPLGPEGGRPGDPAWDRPEEDAEPGHGAYYLGACMIRTAPRSASPA